jgi:hypothetical protein
MFLSRIDWPETNPDPKGSAALFALLTAPILVFSLRLIALFLGDLWEAVVQPSGVSKAVTKP